MHRMKLRSRGQAAGEVIFLVVLIALAIVLGVRFFGSTVRTKYDCATRSIAEGGQAVEGCAPAGPAPGGDGPGDERGGPPDREGGGSDGNERGDPTDGAGAPREDPGPIAPGLRPERIRRKQQADNPIQTPQEALEKAKELLDQSVDGSKAIRFLEDNNVPIELRAGNGSFFNGQKIVLAPRLDPEILAFYIAHEVNHAEFRAEGKTADPLKMSRDAFIDAMIEEETVGTVGPIEIKRELEDKGVKISATFPGERQYNEGFEEGVRQLLAQNPNASELEQELAGRAAAKEAVREAFNDGILTNSIDNRDYRTYYGSVWDKAVAGTVQTGGTEPRRPPGR